MMTLDRLNRLYAARCIRHCNGDLERAAKILGISRSTLYRWFPAETEEILNKEQQIACKKLKESQENYLKAYGWTQRGNVWIHPRRTHEFPLQDALSETRADPKLGWP